jgi:hypothetical protein
MVASFGRHPPKTNKEIRDLIIQSSDKYAAPTAQYGYGIPNFLALTRSVKDFDKIILFLIQIQLLKLFRSGFQKVLIKERLFFYTVLGQKF